MTDNAIFLLKRMIYIIGRKKITRTTNQVLMEYESGWEKYWEYLNQADNMDKWLNIQGVDDVLGYYNINNKMCYQNFNSANFYRARLAQMIQRHFPNAKSLTEYGSGLGRNLLYLKKIFPTMKMYGYELCSSGVEISKVAAKKFDADIHYAQLDYVEDPSEKYLHPITDVSFTMFSLEQIPEKNGIALNNILKKSELGSIHFEPVPERYPKSIRGMLGRLDHRKVGYLNGFDKAAQEIFNTEIIVENLESSHNPIIFPTAYIFKKGGFRDLMQRS